MSDADEKADYFDSSNSIIFSSALLALLVIGYRINTRLIKDLPESGAAMTLGFVVGAIVRLCGLEQEEQLINFRGGFFFFVLLPPIIFEAGWSLKTRIFVDNLGAIITFAVFGTLVSTWVVSNSIRLAAETGFFGLANTWDLTIQCHLFGALISATDPVATIALFGGARFRADPLLHSLVNGESVLNDATAIVLFSTLSHSFNEESPALFSPSVLGRFFFVLISSLAVGVAAGAICSWCFVNTSSLKRFPDYELAAMLLSAYLTFSLSQFLGLSGIVSRDRKSVV